MENFFFIGKRSLPSVDFNADSGHLSIKGHSIQGSDPEYLDLFIPMIKWIDDYAIQPATITIMDVALDYYCTGTSRRLLAIFEGLDRIFLAGHNVSVKWFHEKDNEDQIEAGNEYKAILKLPFHLVELS